MIHVARHHAMATWFEVRIAGDEPEYAAQTAQVLFAVTDQLENMLSRFRDNSDICALAQLQPGETLQVSEATGCCLALAREMERVTNGAFSITAAARQTGSEPPCWTLGERNLTVRCDAGRLAFDLGAIGKGFALDRMAQELADWDCPAFLLVAGGSSILAGDSPPGTPGWSVGLGGGQDEARLLLQHGSLSGSGVAVQGRHILDPRTGQPANLRDRAWAQAPSAAASDALSTAFMVLTEAEIAGVLAQNPEWQAYLPEAGRWRKIEGVNAPKSR